MGDNEARPKNTKGKAQERGVFNESAGEEMYAGEARVVGIKQALDDNVLVRLGIIICIY